MREMKDSGIEWIGDVPRDWEIVRVKEKYSFNTGFTPDTQQSNYYNDENGYEWATIADIIEGKVNTPTKSLVSRSFIEQYHKKIIKPNSLLYSFKLSVGQTAITDRPMYTNEALASFEQTSKNNISFFKYSSMLIEHNANTNIYGAKILNQQLIKNAYVTFPSLQEQRRIADYLDEKCSEIDSLTKDIQEQIETLEKYKKSVITEAVTKGLDPNVEMKDSGIEWIGEVPKDWSCWKLGSFSFITKLAGFEFTNYFDYNAGGDVIAIRGLNLKNLSIDTSAIQTITKKVSDMLPRSKIKLNNILVSYAGTVGNIGFLEDSTKCYHLAPNVGKIEILSSNLLAKYVAYYLLSYSGQEAICQLKNKNAQESISMENLRKIKVLIPPLLKQKVIVKFLDDKCAEIDEAIDIKKEQLDTLNEYKKSLIYEYVTGKKEVPVNE